MVVGCATQQPAAPTVSGQGLQAVPPDSPLANIREGMGFAELTSILGAPTDRETAVTGKAFIPFYFGADRVMTCLYYKGLGRICLSGEGAGVGGGGGRIVKIEYDPHEAGFRK
jgi:hypothetical protein